MNKKLIVLSMMLTIALTGCSNAVESVPASPTATAPATTAATTEAATEATTKTTEAASSVKTIGKEKSGEKVFIAELTNNTGKDIKAFSVKAGPEKDFPGSMLEKDDVFKKSEKRVLYYEEPDFPDNTDLPQDNSPIISTEYTIKLTFSDDTTAELHQFPFLTMDKATIECEDGIVFIKYESKVTGENVSTKEAEDMIASSGSGSETPVQETPQAVDNNDDGGYTPAQETPVYTPDPEPVYTPDPEPVQQQTQAVAPPPVQEPVQQQTEAQVADPDPNGGCLGGGALFN